jgi:hypothetical protein
MKRNYYNIYKDGELIHKGITSGEVTKITGISNVYLYATRGYTKNGLTMEISHQVETKTKEGETKQNELLKIWDDKTKSFLHEEIKRKDVEKMFDLPSYKLSQYISQNYYIQGRYLVSRAGEKPKMWTQEQIDAWNEIREAAELLRTGKGKIVRKKVNGKWIGWVEVIG